MSRRERERDPKTVMIQNSPDPLSVCRCCGETERDTAVVIADQVIDGRRHVWTRTRCAKCGQMRIDKEVREI